MDCLLPDDETMEKMKKAYDEGLSGKAYALRYIPDAESVASPHSALSDILFLYIAMLLSYNIAYGNQIYDAHRSVGGIRCAQSTFGSINNLGTNAR